MASAGLVAIDMLCICRIVVCRPFADCAGLGFWSEHDDVLCALTATLCRGVAAEWCNVLVIATTLESPAKSNYQQPQQGSATALREGRTDPADEDPAGASFAILGSSISLGKSIKGVWRLGTPKHPQSCSRSPIATAS